MWQLTWNRIVFFCPYLLQKIINFVFMTLRPGKFLSKYNYKCVLFIKKINYVKLRNNYQVKKIPFSSSCIFLFHIINKWTSLRFGSPSPPSWQKKKKKGGRGSGTFPLLNVWNLTMIESNRCIYSLLKNMAISGSYEHQSHHHSIFFSCFFDKVKNKNQFLLDMIF